jgi:hypothetical protein
MAAELEPVETAGKSAEFAMGTQGGTWNLLPELYNSQIKACWAIGPLVTWQVTSWWHWEKGRSAPLTKRFSPTRPLNGRVAAVV